jgi:spore maturation protein CgeB
MTAAVPELKLSLHGINGQPNVLGPAYDDALSRCRIGLNISRRNDAYLYSSDRIAQMIGNGLATCIDRATGYSDIFSDDEMVFYSSENELFEKLARLKKDDAERCSIAENGWKRYTTLFNSTTVAQFMLDALYGRADTIKMR